jgi:hypothetical protein
MQMISEETLKRTNHPIYAKRVEEMEAFQAELLLAFKKVLDWNSASIEDQRAFLKTCQASESVAAIMINHAMFPSEPKILFKGDLWLGAREKICPKPFKVRIAAVEKNDTCIYFRRPQEINRASWYRSEPRGEMAVLCSFFGHQQMGFIDPTETEKMWFKHLYGTLPFNKISQVVVEETEVIFFEHPLHIVRFITKKIKK